MYSEFDPAFKRELIEQFEINMEQLCIETNSSGSYAKVKVSFDAGSAERYSLFNCQKKIVVDNYIIDHIVMNDPGELIAQAPEFQVMFELFIDYIVIDAAKSFLKNVVVYTRDPIAQEMLAKHRFALSNQTQSDTMISDYPLLRASRPVGG